MPTMSGREKFAARAIEYFNRQDYEGPLELVVVHSDPAAPALLHNLNNAAPRRQVSFHYVPAAGYDFAVKANIANTIARGEYRCTWDDDDWHAPWRVSYQMEALADYQRRHHVKLHRCVLRKAYYRLPDGTMLLGDCAAGGHDSQTPRHAAGHHGTLLYTGECWALDPYDESAEQGADYRFQVAPARKRYPCLMLQDPSYYVVIRHYHNTWNTEFGPPTWRPAGVTGEQIMGADEAWYKENIVAS